MAAAVPLAAAASAPREDGDGSGTPQVVNHLARPRVRPKQEAEESRPQPEGYSRLTNP